MWRCAGLGRGAARTIRRGSSSLGIWSTPYPKAVRAAVLRAMAGEALPAAEMSRLNWRLGGIYADCVEKAAAKFGVKVGLVGCHGQTVHHEAVGACGFWERRCGRPGRWARRR